MTRLRAARKAAPDDSYPIFDLSRSLLWNSNELTV